MTDPLSQPESFTPQPSRGMNKTLLTVVSVVGGLLIIGGGALAYFDYFQSPEKIVQKMTTKLSETKSLEYSGEIKAELDPGDLLGNSVNLLQLAQPAESKKAGGFSINFTGKTDIQNLDDSKGLLSLNVKIDAPPQGEFTFGLEMRTIGKIIYVKLSSLPNLGLFDLGAVRNQWIKIDTGTLKKDFGSEKIEEQLKETEKKEELTPEQTEKLKIAFQQAKILQITEKLASEKIEGENTYHYKFTINKEGTKKLFTDIDQIMGNKTSTETEEELAELFENFEGTELSKGEIWIGKKDLLPYKISLNTIVEETEKSKTSGKVNFTIFFKNFNKPVEVEVPEQTKSLEEFLGGLFGGLPGPTPSKAIPPTQ